MTWVPGFKVDIVSVAVPVFGSTVVTGAVPIELPFSKNSTVPVGLLVPAGAFEIVAVNVTFSPSQAGLLFEVTVVVVPSASAIPVKLTMPPVVVAPVKDRVLAPAFTAPPLLHGRE